MAVHLVLNTQHAPVYGEGLEPQCRCRSYDTHPPTLHAHTPAQSRFSPVFSVSVNEMKIIQLGRSEIQGSSFHVSLVCLLKFY